MDDGFFVFDETIEYDNKGCCTLGMTLESIPHGERSVLIDIDYCNNKINKPCRCEKCTSNSTIGESLWLAKDLELFIRSRGSVNSWYIYNASVYLQSQILHLLGEEWSSKINFLHFKNARVKRVCSTESDESGSRRGFSFARV